MNVSYRNVVVKGLLLFIILNLLYALLDPLPALGRLSGYNHLFPGRPRLPYGENPAEAYNFSLFSLEAMFAAHEITAQPKPADEFRVVLIGDSSVWGYLLPPDQTLSGHLNAAGLQTPAGQTVRVYNLGYPTMSLTKDLLLLSRAMRYQPDLVIWLVTLESMPGDKQVQGSPILQNNPAAVRELIQAYHLPLDPNDPAFVQTTWWGRTLVGQRRPLADLLRLQLYGVPWAATGIDQFYPTQYDRPQSDLPAEQGFHGLQPPTLQAADLAWDVLAAGPRLAGDTPVLIVNEPIFISRGQNSDLRYNFFYPRWAYDQYQAQLAARCQAEGWRCLDLWDLVPAAEFSNSAIHLTPAGSAQLAARLHDALSEILVDVIR
jgi:hypothetical protein